MPEFACPLCGVDPVLLGPRMVMECAVLVLQHRYSNDGQNDGYERTSGHLVRPRRVKCGEDRAGQQPCTAYETSGRDRRLLFLSRAPRCPTGVARPGSENAHETYKFPGTAPE